MEYHDPSGLYPLIASQLSARLPLRNLHWKSPSRPLRSIDSLHVELVPAPGLSLDGISLPLAGQASNNAGSDNTSRPGTSGQGAGSSAELGRDGVKAPPKERRHQIPGLRRTPYLKVYILRCDDSETYKASSRKLLRDWVRGTAPSPQGPNVQDEHDACEWLILHVVLPSTSVAAQPRSSGSGGAGAAPEKSGSGPRWPGRASSTILEKIRADFNTSGKSAPDRVAQVRLQKKDLPPTFVLPTPEPSASDYNETPQEQAHAWTDLVSKLKLLILKSFDARVSQYEEDIKEKDSQRAIPGWNFCTFFVLKEGLARGFESVGLIEDALAGYDELSAGLDSVIHDKVGGGSETQGGTFLPFSSELQQQLLRFAPSSVDAQTALEQDTQCSLDELWEEPLGSGRINYRERILSNQISIYDFKCYIFTRQMSLLLRMAKCKSALPDAPSQQRLSSDHGSSQVAGRLRNGQGQPTKHSDAENLVPLAELCRRALQFLTAVARIVKEDLWSGYDFSITIGSTILI